MLYWTWVGLSWLDHNNSQGGDLLIIICLDCLSYIVTHVQCGAVNGVSNPILLLSNTTQMVPNSCLVGESHVFGTLQPGITRVCLIRGMGVPKIDDSSHAPRPRRRLRLFMEVTARPAHCAVRHARGRDYGKVQELDKLSRGGFSRFSLDAV